MKPITLLELINYTWKNSDFYRQFWGRRGFNPDRDFHDDNDLGKIPILTKEDLLSVPAKRRSMIDLKDNYYFTVFSSGTTTNSLVGIQQEYIMAPHHEFIENLGRNSYSSVLVLRPAIYALGFLGAGIFGKLYRPGSLFSLGDVNDFVFSAKLANEIEADRLIARPSDAIRFASALKQSGYSPSKINFLQITGEALTSATISTLKNLYQKALIFYNYGMTECQSFMGTKSSLCAELEMINPGAYHINTRDFIFEIIDDSSVITTLSKMPTPLIRYNTGDQIIVKENFQCSCNFQKSSIGIIGPRVSGKSYKIGGCNFQTEEIKRVLKKISGLVKEDFKMQIEQVSDGTNVLNFLRFTIRPLGNPTPLLTNIILDTLNQEMRVNQSKLLGDAIKEGSFRPAEINYDATIRGERILPPTEIMEPFQNTRKKFNQ